MRKTTVYPQYFTRNDYKVEPEEVTDRKIGALVRAMTADEKFSLLGGSYEPEEKGKIGNAGYQWGVPRLGVPEAVMYDGPAGVTGVVETTGLPQPAGMADSWDPDMAYAFGKVAASENAACSGNYQLAPQVDTIHSPHFSRNKDIKSEDDLLDARLAVAETKGVQDQHVIATLKHFTVANTMPGFFAAVPQNVVVDEQTLHETYLRPFEEGIREGGAGSVMNSYNRVNGHYSTDNREMNVGVLRDQWGFQGSLMSDWGSVHNFTLNQGMDIEMPYPAFNDRNRIMKNIQRGKITMDDIDGAVRHVLWGMASAGLLSLVQLDENGEVMEDRNHPLPIQMEWRYEEEVQNGLLTRNAQVCREILAESIVLLKNKDNELPLKNTEGTVLIGLSAEHQTCGEMQERSYGRLCRMQNGKEAFKEVTGQDLPAYTGIDYVGVPIPGDVLYTDPECTEHGVIRTIGILAADEAKGRVAQGPGGAGFALAFQHLTDEDGEAVDVGMIPAKKDDTEGDSLTGVYDRTDPCIDFSTNSQNYKNAEGGNAFREGAYTWKGYLRAPESGEYTLKLESIGGDVRFLIELEGVWTEIAGARTREGTQWPWDSVTATDTGMGIISRKVTLEEGKVYPICVMAEHTVKGKDLQVRCAWVTPSKKKSDYDAALAAAADADTIVFYGVNREDVGDLGPQGPDPDHSGKIPDITLVPSQKKLFLDVAAAKKEGAKLILVVVTSNAVALGDIEGKADAVLTCYMGGQESAAVMAEVIMGKINPSGKLAQTWPAENSDTPLTDTPEHFHEREEGIVSGKERVIQLSEGIYFGYRWYDWEGVAPLYEFGHGLSYTSYLYENLEVIRDGNSFIAELDVTNTGDTAGDEIVQLYLGEGEVPAYAQMAVRELCGFLRVKNIQPGEKRHVEIPVDSRSLYFWDSAWELRERPDGTKDKWHKVTGTRTLYVGASSRDIRLEAEIEVLPDEES